MENDFNGISAAIYSYQDRYRRLPGDDSGAGRFDTVTEGTTGSGDANGVLAGTFDSTENGDESRLFWLHLRAAGLVAGESNISDANNDSPYQQPLNAFGGISGVSTDASEGGSVSDVALPGLFVGYTLIPQDIAVILETRTDDGQSDRGSLQSDDASTGNNYTSDNNPLIEMYFAL